MPEEKIIEFTFLTLSFVAILIGIILVILFNKYIGRKNKLLESQRKSEEEHEKHLQAIELKALRSQMNPHFVHNSLNAIQYFIQRNEVDLSETYLVKFSKLIRLFFEYSRRQFITLEEEIELLENYIQIEQLRFEDRLSYSIDIDQEIDVSEYTIPSMILQPIVENAINHGLFHKKGNGKVIIKFIYRNPTTFWVYVEDDGIGVLKAREMFQNSSKNYKSRSSAVLQERLELLNQTKDWNITYTIQDLSEVNQNSGTLVSLIFNQLHKS